MLALARNEAGAHYMNADEPAKVWLGIRAGGNEKDYQEKWQQAAAELLEQFAGQSLTDQGIKLRAQPTV